MGGVFIPGRGRFARLLVVLAALLAFVYSIAKDAPGGVIAFTSVYLAAVVLNAGRWWRAKRAVAAHSAARLD